MESAKADVINYKVFLINENTENEAKPEIRRFSIDFDVATNYMYLQNKLQTIFTNLVGKSFTISWRDSENDDILISSNEELEIAFRETKDIQIRKLYVTMHSNSNETKSPTYIDLSTISQIQHTNVVCDGCNNNIYGFRYKCLQCPDYDLCHKCEAKGMHPEHCMLRIPVPFHWESYYGKRLSYRIHKFVRKAGINSSDGETSECPRKNRRHNRANADHFDQASSWIDTFTTFLNYCKNLSNENPILEQVKKAENIAQQSCNKTDANSSTSRNEKTSEDTHIEFLKNISENLTQFLDPLGIDVNVQIKSDKSSEKKDSTLTTNKAKDFDNSSNYDEKITSNEKNYDKVNESLKEDNYDSQKRNEFISSNFAEKEKQLINNSENSNDWTLLDNDVMQSSSIASSNSSETNSLKEKLNLPSGSKDKKSQNQTIYPSLPNIGDNIWHENSKIQESVEKMMNMGFSNEKGWLTKFLVSVDGDINKALHILHPSD